MRQVTSILLFLLVSCTKVINIDLPSAPEKLVVNCLFSTGEVFTVHLSHSQDILSEDSTEIENADLMLYANDVYQGILNYIDYPENVTPSQETTPQMEVIQKSLFPIMPTVSYSYRF